MRRTIWTLLAVLSASAAMLVGAAGATAAVGRIVALGDSDPAASGLNGADPAAPVNCFRTIYGYPRIAADVLGASGYADATCASATFPDLYSTQNVFGSPTNPPQLNTLNGSESIVTLTMGDNDADGAGVTDNCLKSSNPSSTPCKSAYPGNSLSNEAAAIAGPLGSALDAIRARAPKAAIFVVGYPRLLPSDVTACWGKINVTAGDAPLVTGWQQTMNDTARSVAAAHGARFVDPFSDWSPGTDGCSDQSTAWLKNMNDPYWPIHPTRNGQGAIAARLVAAVKAAGLWADPSAPVLTASPVFTKMHVVAGAHSIATLTRPRRGGGKVTVTNSSAESVELRLQRKRSGRIVGGSCRIGSTKRGADRCSAFLLWGSARSLDLRAGSTTLWLTGSYRKRAAKAGVYRLRVTGSSMTATSRQFKIVAR